MSDDYENDEIVQVFDLWTGRWTAAIYVGRVVWNHHADIAQARKDGPLHQVENSRFKERYNTRFLIPEFVRKRVRKKTKKPT